MRITRRKTRSRLIAPNSGHNTENCIQIGIDGENGCKRVSRTFPTFFLSNTRSLVNKIEDLETVIRENQIDIACITETWLTDNIPNSTIEIRNYSLVRNDRSTGKRGGGVCAYIKTSIGFDTIDDLTDPLFESLWLYLRPNRLARGVSCLVVGIFYHPPNEEDSLFLDYLISSLDKALIKHPNAGIMLLGDFNRLNYQFICNHFNLKQTVKNPTRGDAILDLVLTNLSQYYNIPQILSGIGLSDHNSLIVCPVETVSRTKAIRAYKRKVNPYLKHSFGRWLVSVDWSFIYELPTCSQKLNVFYELLRYAIDIFFPQRKVKEHPTDKPWITPELKILIQQRQQAMFSDPEVFKKLRNKVNRLCHSLKASFFANKVKNCDDTASWWKSIKQLAGFPNKKAITSIIISGNEVSSSELATKINQSFLKVTNSTTSLPPFEKPEINNSIRTEIARKYHISTEDVYFKLSNLKRSKAAGPDAIPSWILKDYAMEFSLPIAEIFNASIQERHVPDLWKEAEVIPLLKTQVAKDLENDLRPISLTSILSKTMERFVAGWIMPQIRHLIDKRQFGSLSGLSTTHALLSFVHHLYKTTDDSNNSVRIFLLDFSKAFDRIDHSILLEKMEAMAIDPVLIEWVQSFLSGRKQRVRIGQVSSRFESVSGGVPQGSVLGPLLFIIMINDLLKEWDERWKYVDDTSLAETIIKNQESTLQSVLDGIEYWCRRNKMSLNPRKCKELFICFWKNKQNLPPLTVNEQSVDLVKSAKILGVILSDDLKWNEHVSYIVKKSSKRLYMLRLLRRARADPKTLLAVYLSCVRPMLEYCAQIWHYSIPNYLTKDIERIQSRALKIIDPSTPPIPYSEALEKYDIPTLAARRDILSSTFFRKNVHLQPDIIQIDNQQTYNLRICNKLIPIKCRTNRFKNSFFPSSVKNYNEF